MDVYWVIYSFSILNVESNTDLCSWGKNSLSLSLSFSLSLHWIEKCQMNMNCSQQKQHHSKHSHTNSYQGTFNPGKYSFSLWCVSTSIDRFYKSNSYRCLMRRIIIMFLYMIFFIWFNWNVSGWRYTCIFKNEQLDSGGLMFNHTKVFHVHQSHILNITQKK